MCHQPNYSVFLTLFISICLFSFFNPPTANECTEWALIRHQPNPIYFLTLFITIYLCLLSTPQTANECTEWAFMRHRPTQGSISFDADGTTATVTCNDGFAFRNLILSDDTELTDLTYTCTGGATQFTETTIGFGDYVPQCVRKFDWRFFFLQSLV